MESRPTTRSMRESQLKKLQDDRFMVDFDPETSARERRKLKSKLKITKKTSSIYDEHGIHIASGKDLCDCLMTNPDCPGCFFPCQKCGSSKCGMECRVNRKFVYDSIDFEGCNLQMKNPLGKT